MLLAVAGEVVHVNRIHVKEEFGFNVLRAALVTDVDEAVSNEINVPVGADDRITGIFYYSFHLGEVSPKMVLAADLMTHTNLVGGVLGELKDHQALPVKLYAILAKVEIHSAPIPSLLLTYTGKLFASTGARESTKRLATSSGSQDSLT